MPEMKIPEQIQPKSLDDYLEVMSKAIFQTGMSWRVVENKWDGIRDVLLGFDPDAIASFDDAMIEEVASDRRIIRNRRKIGAIVENARRMIELEQSHGSFQSYLRSHGDFWAALKALKKDFKFMGDTGCYYFLYVVGEEVVPHEEYVRVTGRLRGA